MTGILDRPRTITVRGVTMRFANFAGLAELAGIQLDVLKDAEAKSAESAVAPAERWASVADAADFLADICAAQEDWLAEQDAQLASEAEAIWTAIRQLEGVDPMTPSSEGP